MPLALFALTIGAFAIGTTEFVIVGLVPTIAQQLSISLPSAGLLVSIYALGVAIGAPVLTALTGRMPRKQLLLALMVLFTAGNILAWQAPGYETLILARLLTGLAHGVFFSIGSTIATSQSRRQETNAPTRINKSESATDAAVAAGTEAPPCQIHGLLSSIIQDGGSAAQGPMNASVE